MVVSWMGFGKVENYWMKKSVKVVETYCVVEFGYGCLFLVEG